MKTLYTFLLTIVAFILIILACSKWDLERIDFTKVITVGVIEVGASSAFLIGDIEGLRDAEVTETGFVYSKNASDESSLRLGNQDVESKVSLRSDTTSDRAFAVRITGLETNTSYSFRAYIRLSGIQDAIYGGIDSFSTGGASLSVLSVSRSNPGCPTTVTIEIQVEQSGSSGETTFGLIWSDSEDNDQPTFQDGSFVSGTPDVSGIVILELGLECDKVYFVRGGALLPGGIPVLSDVKVVTASPNGKWVRRAPCPLMTFSPEHGVLSGKISIGETPESSIYGEYAQGEDTWILKDRSSSINRPFLSEGVSIVIGERLITGFGNGNCAQPNPCLVCNDCICPENQFFVLLNSIPMTVPSVHGKRQMNFRLREELFRHHLSWMIGLMYTWTASRIISGCMYHRCRGQGLGARDQDCTVFV